jgi:hypothetical protein
MFEDEKNLDAIMFMECSGGGASWGHDNELSSKFWRAWKPYICCRSFITVFSYFVPAKTWLG